jgi:predicted DNA-binding protein
MPRQRNRSQLAIQAPPELLERLRAAAAAQRRTVTGLVIEWIEAGYPAPCRLLRLPLLLMLS